jgi:cAMP-dependent protein kinase regulator
MDESDLRSIALFEPLSRDARRVVAQHADRLRVPEGTKLVSQGDFAYEFFVIVDGSAEVVRDGERVAELSPGDFLGEMGIVGKAVRNATVVTTSEADVIVMAERDFRSMARQSPDVASRIEAAVEERSRRIVG